jgi:formylglycine-generating enzyme required for sulfatase activity
MRRLVETGPTREHRARRTHVLRSHGLTWEQMAAVWIADYPTISPRTAFRWAHNLSHQDVADRWNRIDPGEPTLTKARIYEFEAWPNGGRRPSVSGLAMLARIYHTTGRNLLADHELSVYGVAVQAELDKFDFRHLDPNRHMVTPTVQPSFLSVESTPVTLISRPRIVHLVDGKEMLLVDGDGLPAFYMDATPVTNEDYAKFVVDTGHRTPSHWENGQMPDGLSTHPVVNVSLHDAMSYATWAHKRLPTALEWEKAAGAEHGYLYPWGDRPSVAKCNVRESGIRSTTAVGTYRSGISPYGIHDMTGNVWEWCNTETTVGRYVLKGSAFTSPFEAGQTTAVNDAAADMADDDTGFRCVAPYQAAAL